MTETTHRRRPRTALWTASVVGLVVVLLVVVLATREPASQRLAKSPLVGKGVPALVGRTVDGSARFDIDEHRGEWVLVNFFATWCTPCIEEHDDLVRFAQAHRDEGDASLVSVVFSDDADDVERFFDERGGSWPVLADDGGAIATAFGVARVPETYLVAPSGLVVGKLLGGIDFAFVQEQIARLEAQAS